MHPLEQVFHGLYCCPQKQFVEKSWWQRLVLISSCMFIGGMISVLIGKDLGWDMANYHYYNAYSFLYQRWRVDYWPSANVHVHLTPTLDLFAYFLINHFQPIVTMFIIGAIHGLNIWLLYLIASSVFHDIENMPSPSLFALIVTCLGIYGPSILPGMGSFQHDNLMSIFVLGYVYLHWQWLRSNNLNQFKNIIFANLLIGFAVGCKLTVGLYVVAGLTSYLFITMPIRHKLTLIILSFICISFGILLSDGYWMLFLWQHYHNPVYPFLNGIFHSASFPSINWRDIRSLPKNNLQALLYPFYFSLYGYTGERPFRDFRFAILYVLFVLSILKWMFLKTKIASENKWLVVFFILSYVVWQHSFSIMRYAASLELLAPLMIAMCCAYLFTHPTLRACLIVMLGICIFSTTTFIKGVRSSAFQGNYFNVSLPDMVKTSPYALVLIPYPAYATSQLPKPQNYLIPFFPPHWQFAGITFMNGKYTPDARLLQLIRHFPGPFFVLTESGYLGRMSVLLESLHLMYGKCGKIRSDRQLISQQTIFLCPLNKVDS